MKCSQSSDMTISKTEVRIPPYELGGFLNVPEGARSIVVFAHGSGSSRFSPRNTYVAEALNERGYATLLFDLLTREEDGDRSLVFNIPFLARRLSEVTAWVHSQKATADLAIGYFGASTGAAAALTAEPLAEGVVKAVVSRGGRPDLTDDASLSRVKAATLLIVGGHDEPVIGLNEEVLPKMSCPYELVIVPGATHLFEEPGTLDRVIELAADWFDRYLK